MKHNLYLIGIATLGLSLATAMGEENHPSRGQAKQSAGSGGARHTTTAGTSQHFRATTASRNVTPRAVTRSTYRSNVYRSNPAVVNRRSNVVVHRNRSNVTVNRNRTVVNRNASVNRNTSVNRNRNVTVSNNWRGSRFAGSNYAAFRNYHRQWHDRGWWRSHYNRIVFVGGGWWFWNAGYWFPAWGYDPYGYYPYDGPIYGYNGLAPNQVIVDVQGQLQRDGYYTGPIDGVLGPMTRQAIAAFQTDHGLAVTASIDEPTLSTLGIS